MTKAELVDLIAKRAKLNKVKSEVVLNAITATIVNAVKKGGVVRLVGFGTFDAIKRSARKGRNPRTGQEIRIKASTAPRFRAGKSLKGAVNK